MIRRLLSGAARGRGVRREPERIVLEVVPGTPPSPKPPVRIFLGSETAQGRAERVFVWSIEQVRDPARVYEIYLMKELVGFRRLWWLTGFTNYRFAVPELAGGHGRAIYNDVDQIYLADPALLFDTNMKGHGFLAIDRRDSSVMLIDCARMAQVWNRQAAQRRGKRRLLQAALDSELWGPLSGEWNARDEEYQPGCSKLLHYTALHTQPWHPFPRQFTYQKSAVGQIWIDLERSADAAGFEMFRADAPSRLYLEALERLREKPNRLSAALALDCEPDVRGLCTNWEATSVLDCSGHAGDLPLTLSNAVTVTHGDPSAALGDERYDGVVCRGFLHALPLEDLPWFLGEVFRRSRRFVYVQVSSRSLRRALIEKWHAALANAAAHHPQVHWRLVVDTRDWRRKPVLYVRQGGPQLDEPRIWVLTQNKPGHTIQSVGLAEALGWSYEVKGDLATAAAYARWRLRKLFPMSPSTQALLALRQGGWQWPEVLIATGWRPAHLARWLRWLSCGRTRVVRIGRKGSQVVSSSDVVVSCTHFGLPPHPQRIEIVAPLNPVSPAHLAKFLDRGRQLFGDVPTPRVVFLVGGGTVRHRLDEETAERLGREVRASTDAVGGTVFAITSRRTGAAAAKGLRRGLGAGARVYEWTPGDEHNPYFPYLAAADAIVVTGESESMLGEAVSTGKPVYIQPLPERPPSLWLRFTDWAEARARSLQPNRRGTARPQQGLDYICARLFALGLLQPPRDLHELHKTLIALGVAELFSGKIETGTRPALQEAASVADKVGELLGLSGPEDDDGAVDAPLGVRRRDEVEQTRRIAVAVP